MRSRSLAGRSLQAATVAVGCSAVLAACGGGTRSPDVSSLPLVHGAHVVTKVTRCDKGANPYCALQLVVTDPRYASSRLLVLAERDFLRARGWTGASPQTADQLAAESPGHRLRVTYATAYGDLKGVVLRWILRADQIANSLSSQLFAGTAAMSVQLQAGSD